MLPASLGTPWGTKPQSLCLTLGHLLQTTVCCWLGFTCPFLKHHLDPCCTLFSPHSPGLWQPPFTQEAGRGPACEQHGWGADAGGYENLPEGYVGPSSSNVGECGEGSSKFTFAAKRVPGLGYHAVTTPCPQKSQQQGAECGDKWEEQHLLLQVCIDFL